MHTSSVSFMWKEILLSESPTLLNSRMTPAPLRADVEVDLGKSSFRSKNSTKSESERNCGCLATSIRKLKRDETLKHTVNIENRMLKRG